MEINIWNNYNTNWILIFIESFGKWSFRGETFDANAYILINDKTMNCQCLSGIIAINVKYIQLDIFGFSIIQRFFFSDYSLEPTHTDNRCTFSIFSTPATWMNERVTLLSVFRWKIQKERKLMHIREGRNRWRKWVKNQQKRINKINKHKVLKIFFLCHETIN